VKTETQPPRSQARHLLLAEIGLIAVAAVWGLTFVMVKDAIETLPVMTFLAYRFLAAATLVSAVWGRQLRALSAEGWRAGLLMGIFLTAGYILQTVGLRYTTASNAGFITGMFVVLTPLFGAVVLGQGAGRPAWIAGAASAIGLFLLSGGGRVHLVGDLLVLGCACSFSWHILVTDRGVRGHHFGALVVVQLAACGVFSLAVAAVAGDLEVPRSWPVWSALIVTSVFASALGFFVQTYAQKHAPPARTALILASEPAFAGLFAFILAGETLGPLGWTGAGLILAAILTVEVVPYLRPVRPLPER
jgi:drug/metabolite transporter (DMT)-like permease